jgi:hypothetical protein
VLHEDNAREGFFEHADFEKVVVKLPEPKFEPHDILTAGLNRGELLADMS